MNLGICLLKTDMEVFRLMVLSCVGTSTIAADNNEGELHVCQNWSLRLRMQLESDDGAIGMTCPMEFLPFCVPDSGALIQVFGAVCSFLH